MGRIADRLLRRYSEASGKGQENTATKDDLNRLRKDLDNNLKKQSRGQATTQTAGRAVRMMSRGFGNIGKSLNSPYDKRRPKISQMPARRRDMGIVENRMNLDYLKNPMFRGRDLRGRKNKQS